MYGYERLLRELHQDYYYTLLLLITPFFRFLLQGFAQDVVKKTTVFAPPTVGTLAHFSTKETPLKELYCLDRRKKRVRGQTLCSTSCGFRRLRPHRNKKHVKKIWNFWTFVGVAASQIRRCVVVCGNPRVSYRSY